MIKNKYKDDYQRIAAGRYSYTGKYYTLPMDEKAKRKSGWVNLGTAAVFFVLEIAAGLLNPDSSRTAWIVFPYFFLFLPMSWMARGAFAYLGAPLKMERSCYQNSVIRMKHSCMAILILSGINAILDVLYIFLNRREIRTGLECLYLCCFLCMILTGILYGKNYDRMYGGIVIDE
jgi:hypothetical protein